MTAQQKQFVRFTVAQIVEHWILFVSFTGLAVTGLPQKFAGDGWAEAMIAGLGGIEQLRIIHRVCAIIMMLASVYHIVVVGYKLYVLRVRWTMLPGIDDAKTGIQAVLYNLGLTKQHPKFDRYNFAEKMEYWALVWGTVIMGLTGFIMWNPIMSARIMPGEVIPASKAAHGAEAILAVLAIIVWHFYSVHIKTLNKAVFTGKLSESQMHEEHALELERIESGLAGTRPAQEIIEKRKRVFAPIATVTSLLMLLGVFYLTTAENTAITPNWEAQRSRAVVFVPLTPTPLPTAVPTKVPTATVPAPTPAPGSTAVPTNSGTANLPKPLPASHVGRTTCNMCHANGVGDALPADHKGREDSTCTMCHKTGSAPASGQATTAPATGAAAATSAATKAPSTSAPATAPASSGTAGLPKPLPASHVGRTTCNMCHANGVGNALPADHKGREDSTCTMCHKAGSAPAGAQATTAPATVAATKPAATTAPATAAATKAPSTSAPATAAATASSSSATTPKPLPASHVGRTTCNMCHANGVGNALPADHKGREDSTCTMCHKTSSAPAAGAQVTAPTTATVAATKPAATTAPATVAATKPAATTAPATVAATKAPSTSAPATAPASSGTAGLPKPLPASHVGRTTCNMCHANGVGNALPADHKGREDSTCTMCHKAGSAPAGAQATTAPATVAATKPAATTAPATSAGASVTLTATLTSPASTGASATVTATQTSGAGASASATVTKTATLTTTATVTATATVTTTATVTATAASASASASSTPAGKDVCLACHGPFDKLAASTANYEAPSGEKGTPHRYAPHDTKDATAITECSNCHTPHPIPPTSKPAEKANVDWCYNSCHHQMNFTPCKTCH